MTQTRIQSISFEAAKKFRMNGVDVAPGDVVDVSCLSLLRIEQMEATGFGMRVGSEEPVTKAAPRKRVSQPRKTSTAKTRARRSSASAKE